MQSNPYASPNAEPAVGVKRSKRIVEWVVKGAAWGTTIFAKVGSVVSLFVAVVISFVIVQYDPLDSVKVVVMMFVINTFAFSVAGALVGMLDGVLIAVISPKQRYVAMMFSILVGMCICTFLPIAFYFLASGWSLTPSIRVFAPLAIYGNYFVGGVAGGMLAIKLVEQKELSIRRQSTDGSDSKSV